MIRDSPPLRPNPAAVQTNERWSKNHPFTLVVVSVGIGLAAAVSIGSLIGWLVYSGATVDCGNDSWCELGAALYGLLGGLVAAAVAHIVAGVAFIRQHRPKGERKLPITMHLVLSVVVVGFLLALVGI